MQHVVCVAQVEVVVEVGDQVAHREALDPSIALACEMKRVSIVLKEQFQPVHHKRIVVMRCAVVTRCEEIVAGFGV